MKTIRFQRNFPIKTKAMMSMKKIQLLILGGVIIGFSSCISVQPSTQSASFEFDEAYWQPGEHFGEPDALSASALNQDSTEDFYSSNSPRRNSYAPGLNNQEEYSSMGSMVPMWDPIMGWRLGYQWNQPLLGWGLNSAIGINPYGSYTPHYWNGSGFNSFGSYPGYYSNYPGMVYSPYGAYSPYGYSNYGYYGYGNNGFAGGWNNPYNNNFGWNNLESNNTTSVPRPSGTGGIGSTYGHINRKPKSLTSGQSTVRKNIMVQAMESVVRTTVPRSNINKAERRQENFERAGKVLEQVGRAVVNDINSGSLQPSSGGGGRAAGPSNSSGAGSRPAPSTSPARSAAPSGKPSSTSPKRP